MAKRHVLAQNGIANYAVVCPAGAPPAQIHAAHVICRYLSEMSGAEFFLTSPSGLDGRPPVIVGLCPLSGMFGVPEGLALGPEEYIVRSVDAGIIIAGGSPRGTLYGAYAFLEALGCRFLARDETVIPREKTLEAPALDIREAPAFEYRFGYYRPCLEADLSARLRMNGAEACGFYGGYEKFLRGAHHSFFELVPPDRYFEAHPEYFSMRDGARVANRQLCLTNPEVFGIVRDELRRRLSENPGETIHSVSINDCSGGCECPECRAIDEAEGTQAASLVAFLNRLGEALEGEFPGAEVGTLAYLHTRKPPKTIAPRKNVIIWLCSIECCFAHPIDECVDVYGKNMGKRVFPDDIRGWCALTGNVFVWDYVNNFAHFSQPHPNLRVLAKNLRFFRDCGVRGVFEQGHADCKNGSPPLNELRFYMISKLLWNPDRDENELKEEFLSGYYGTAAEEVGRFIAAFEKKTDAGAHMGISSPPDSDYLAAETLDEAEGALFRAAELAPEGKYRERVNRLFLLIKYPRLAVRIRDGEAAPEEINAFFGEYYSFGYDRLEEGMSAEKRKGYILEMGRANNLIDGHFRDRALEKNKT